METSTNNYQISFKISGSSTPNITIREFLEYPTIWTGPKSIGYTVTEPEYQGQDSSVDIPNAINQSKMEDLINLKLSESSFGFWDNEEDAIYDGRLIVFIETILKLGVFIEDKMKLAEYLSKYPELLSSILSACHQLKSHYSDDIEMILSFLMDPEFGFGYPVLTVRKNKYENNFMDDLEEQTKWLIDKLSETKGTFLITSDFQPIGSGL